MAILKVENRLEEGSVQVTACQKAIIYRYSLTEAQAFSNHKVKIIGIDFDGKEHVIYEGLIEGAASQLDPYAFYRFEIELEDSDSVSLTENGDSVGFNERIYERIEGSQGTKLIYSAYLGDELEETQVVYMDYEDAFLTDRNTNNDTGTTFRVKYDPKVNMKINRQEQKVETLESPYPFILRSPISYYEFDLQGIIAENAFITEDSYDAFLRVPNGFTYESTTSFRKEREYRKRILNWLTNGQEKILRTPTEGEFKVISLMNVSVTPMDQLSRKYYSFSATAVCEEECAPIEEGNITLTPVAKGTSSGEVDFVNSSNDIYRFVINPVMFKEGDFISGMVITLTEKTEGVQYAVRVGDTGRSFNKLDLQQGEKLEYVFNKPGFDRSGRAALKHLREDGSTKATYNLQQTFGMNLPPITLYCIGGKSKFSYSVTHSRLLEEVSNP